MIYYLTNRRNAIVMQEYLATMGRSQAGRITVVTYDRLTGQRRLRLPFGTYVFTCMGSTFGSRVPPSPARRWAIDLHARLVQALGPERVLNDPGRSLSRFGLLRALADAGINRFRAHRVGDRDPGIRYPVIIRKELGTTWQLPPLVDGPEGVEAYLREGGAPEQLAIEFCDTRDPAGVFRKYGCFVVGRRIVPRHVFFSRQWFVKSADLVDPGFVAEELEFLRSNPHEEALLRVCRLANIAYGRIDYALLDGEPQVWEINTPPQIVVPPEKDAPQRAEVHATFAAAFEAALDAIDPPRS